MASEVTSVSTHHHHYYNKENKHPSQAIKKPLTKKAFKLQTIVLFIALIISSNNLDGIHCETKEFDWGDLGVSLASNKAPYNGAGNNLRILVSPAQRRMTKNSYEFDYVNNNSQPISSQGEASYIIPGSSSSYLTQPSSQTSHSAAYSALSASLATLKNRLSARGVSLSSSLGDTASQTGGGGLYQNPTASAYGSTLLTDSQSSPSVAGQHQGQTQGQSQPTYLSVTNQQVGDQQTSSGGYVSGQGQGTDNKTIVLAIPAKINFLTDGRTGTSKQQQQQQQLQQQQHHQQQQQHQQQSQNQQAQQQLAVIQSASGDQQQARSAQDAYANSKQLGLMSGQDNVATVDPASHLVGRDVSGSPVADQEQHHQQQQQHHQQQQQQLQHHHQYVLLNSSPVAPVSEHSQLLQTGTGMQSPQPTPYTQLYQAPAALQTQGPTTGYAVKYIPTYQANIPQPTVPRLYSTGETGIGYSEAQIEEQYGRYGGCIDTCNSADIRWRKYSVSKYKYCCSRSSQYDAQFEQPSTEKLNENSKQADDAFYNYMYRRTRSRRSRRPGSRYSSRYHKQALSSVASSPNEDGSSGDGELVGGGRMAGRDSPYMRFHKSRPSTSSYGSSTDLHDSISTGTNNGNKYTSTKERSYRRGRSRDFDTIDPSHQSYDSQDDETMGSYQSDSQGSRGASPPSSSSTSYGGGDESVGSGGGRYSSDGQVNEEDDVRIPSPGYGADEPSDPEMDKNTSSGIAEGSDYPEEMGAEKQVVGGEEAEPETINAATYKYTANRRKKQAGNGKGSRLRKNSNGKYRKARKNRLNKQASATTEQHSSSSSSNNGQVNGTEYDSSSQGDQYNNNNQELSGSTNGNNNNNNNDDEKQHTGKDSSDSSENADKEAVSFSNRLKSMGLNDSAVVNLSKTTMHLKEILSILEKKAQLKANESTSSSSSAGQTTPSPQTTTSSTTSFYPLSLLGSQYANSAPLQLPSDYLTTELSLKSPYRYEPPSLSTSLSLPSQPYSPMNLDSYSSLASPYGSANQFAGLSSKHLNYAAAAAAAAAGGHHPRKRRTNKHVRYNHNLMMSKPHGLQSASSLLHHSAFAKNPLLSSAYYSSLHYPYQYTPRGTYSSYPYKNLNKNFYPSSLNGPVSSKMASNSGLYSDELRLHGISSLDPLANVASSLRPSTTMRLRSKQFLFQPHVSPLYNRHNMLTQPVDKK